MISDWEPSPEMWPGMRLLQYSSCLYGDMQENAKAFLFAYQERMPAHVGYRGGNAQSYHNWRTGWLVACLAHLPDYGYKGEHLATPVIEAKRYIESRRHGQS